MIATPRIGPDGLTHSAVPHGSAWLADCGAVFRPSRRSEKATNCVLCIRAARINGLLAEYDALTADGCPTADALHLLHRIVTELRRKDFA
jgi:hypothetical protein